MQCLRQLSTLEISLQAVECENEVVSCLKPRVIRARNHSMKFHNIKVKNVTDNITEQFSKNVT